MSRSILSRDTVESLRLMEEKSVQNFWSFESQRFHIALFLCLSTICNGMMRGVMSVAMVCMVTNSTTNSSVVHDDVVNMENVESNSLSHNMYRVDWSPEQQANVHTAFYIGAFISIFVTEYLMNKWDPKNLVSVILLTMVIGSIITPFVIVTTHLSLLTALIRLIMGFASGLLMPCGLFIISKWYPITEKSTAMAIFTTGNQFGIAISMVVTAWLCKVTIGGGWTIAFILYGFLTSLFIFLWHYRSSSRPRSSKYITATELEYVTGRRGDKSRAMSVIVSTPWKKIIVNPCIMAINVNAFAQSFVLIGLVTYLPKFNQEALGMDVTWNGIWSSVPFCVQIITKLGSGTAADAIKKKGIHPTTVTKWANSIACFGSSLCILFAALIGPSFPPLSVCLMCTAMGLFGAFVPGYNTAIVTVAPQFTAAISSYQQFYAQAGSLTAPLLIGMITSQGSIVMWRLAYCIMCAILVIAGLLYLIFGHGESERWGVSEHGSTGPSLSYSVEQANLLLSNIPPPSSQRISRVSYRDTHEIIPITMDELENDVIIEEEEEKEKEEREEEKERDKERGEEKERDKERGEEKESGRQRKGTGVKREE